MGTEIGQPSASNPLGDSNSGMNTFNDQMLKMDDKDDKKEEEEDLEHVPHDKNSVLDIYQWAINEYHELQSIHMSVKYYLKYASKIKAYSTKYKIDLASIPGNILLEGDLNIENTAGIDATDKLDFTEANQLSFENLNKEENSLEAGALEAKTTLTRNASEQQMHIEQMIQMQVLLAKFLSSYLIPMYKRERASLYHKTLKEFVLSEQRIAQSNKAKWKQIL